MPLQGFDSASKNINKKRKERKRGFPGAQKAKSAVGDFVESAGDTLIYQRRQAKARAKAAKTAKQAKKPATTQESLLNIKNEYVGFDPFKKANKSENITKTVTPKVKTKVEKPKVEKPKVKPKAKAPVVKKPAAKAKAPAAKAPKMANTGFTSAADRIRNKGVSNLKPTPSKTKKGSYNFNEGTGPNTSVFDKTKNVAPKTEDKPKRKKRAAKGSRAATLKKGFGY